jgi:RNA polymerase sigma factor (sigma-70 family)
MQEQIESLYASERGRLERLARRQVNRSNAADVVQDVFMTIWSRARDQVSVSPAYLARATRYMAISHFRQELRRAKLLGGLTEEQYAAPVILPDQIVVARQELQVLQNAIAALPDRTRQVFLLNRIHNCTYDEIAFALNLSYSTVEREIAKALLACKTTQ